MAEIVNLTQVRIQKLIDQMADANEHNEVSGVSIVVMQRNGDSIVANYLENDQDEESLLVLMEVGKQALVR